MFIAHPLCLKIALQRSAIRKAAAYGSAGAVISFSNKGYKHLVAPGPGNT
jgi:hypothetical protein